MGARKKLPRVLVTGFSVFPGAPLNPTEHLVPLIEARRGDYAGLCHLTTEVYPVDYQGLPARLEAACINGSPHIAIHFGLSAKAQGITLERLARNAYGVGRPDNVGYAPEAAHIRASGEHYPSTLPFDAIYGALKEANIPASLSDDAGDYLCNYLFYLSRSKLCPGFEPALSGFIHVPPLNEGRESEPANALDLDTLARAADIAIRTCCEAFCKNEKRPA